MNEIKRWFLIEKAVQNSCTKCVVKECPWRNNPRKFVDRTDMGRIRAEELRSGLLDCIAKEVS